MTAEVEAPTGLEWLQGVISDLREQVESLRKQVVGSRMKISSLEADVDIRDRREAELREELRIANEQLDSGSAELKEQIRADVLSDLVILAKRDTALATVLTLLATKTMGVDSLQRLGAPADQVELVRSMAGSIQSAPPPVFMDGSNGLRFTAPPVTAQAAPQARNSMQFTRIPAEEREALEHMAEIETQQAGGAERLASLRASDRM